MIRSLEVVLLRAAVRQLGARGFSLHRLADEATVGLPDLRRLMEFGSGLDGISAERLKDFAKAALSLTPARNYASVAAQHRRQFRSWSARPSLACGNEQGGCEPDARRYRCESCGERQVYGAEELLMEIM